MDNDGSEANLKQIQKDQDMHENTDYEVKQYQQQLLCSFSFTKATQTIMDLLIF